MKIHASRRVPIAPAGFRPAPALLMVALVALAAAGCGRGGGGMPAVSPATAPQAPAAEPYPAPQRLYYDNGGGVQDSLRVIIREEGTFRGRWEQATSRQAVPPPLPEVDFARDMVVLVAAGRLTTEDQIRVDSATVVHRMDAEGTMQPVLSVHVRTTRGCGRFNTEAFPLEILRLRRFDGEIRFEERFTQAEGCVDR